MQMPQLAANQTTQQRDRARIRRALNFSLLGVLLLWAVFAAQQHFDWVWLTVTPHTAAGLLGLLGAPLLHGSLEHVLGNSMGLLLLGSLAGTAYPKASLRALPLVWLGSGLGAWLLGAPGSHHLGASGINHGLLFLVCVLGLLRRDRASIAVGMIAFLFYGGMLMTTLPQQVGVSWESHLGGALAGVLAAFLFRRSDPIPPRTPYSWEIEEALQRESAASERDTLEPPAAEDVPVLWQRRSPHQPRGQVLPFRRRE